MKKIICFGEVLWDLLPSGKLPGGAPMNVAFQCKQLGMDSTMISSVGNDALGKELLAFLNDKKVDTQNIQIHSNLPTSVVKVTLDKKGSPSYEIVQPVAWDEINLQEELIPLVKKSDALVFGSLACRNDTTRNTLFELLEQARWKVFDVNLRAPFYQQSLIESLLKQAHFIKMNDEELELIAAWYTDLKEEKDQLLFLQEKFDLEGICLTKGSAGAALLDEEGQIHQHPAYPIEVQDTIGSGDAFLAGLISKRLQGQLWQDCLAFACATGAYVATQKGATPFFTESAIARLMDNS